ncbi:hypothetical protein JCM3775_001215 [Rhodotorula graminis]
MADEVGVHRLTNRDRNKPRADKALLMRAGVLMERRTDRERDALVARLERAEQELEKARQDGAVAAAMAFTTGGPAVKVLQREVGVLRAKLAEVELAPPTASACNTHHCPSSSDSSALGTPTRIAELEDENRRLSLRIKEIELKTQETSASSSRARNGDAGAACRPCEELSDAVERLKGRLDVLTQDNVKLSSDLKLARAKLNEGPDENVKTRTLENQLDDVKTKLAAAVAVRQAEAQQQKSRVVQLEDALSRKEKERLEGVREWQVKYSTALRTSSKQDESTRIKASRYDALLTSVRLSEDEVSQLLDDPDTPPIRQHLPDLSLLDLLWLLTDQHDEHAAAIKVLEDKLERCEAERARTHKQAAAQVKEERERLQGTIDELQGRLDSEESRQNGSAAARDVSVPRPPLSTTAASSTPSPVVMDRLASTIASLSDEVSQLRDENMTLLLKLAGADD